MTSRDSLSFYESLFSNNFDHIVIIEARKTAHTTLQQLPLYETGRVTESGIFTAHLNKN